MFPKSLRWRCQLWLAFLLVCLLTGFGFTAYQLYRTNRLAQIDAELEERVAALVGDVRKPPGPPPPFGSDPGDAPGPEGRFAPWMRLELDGEPPFHEPDAPGQRPPFPVDSRTSWLAHRTIELSLRTRVLLDENAGGGFYYAVWFRGDTLLARSANAPAALTALRDAGYGPGIRMHTRDTRREAYLVTELGDHVLVGRPVLADLEAMRRFAWWLTGAGLVVLAIGLGGGWLVVGRAIRPVEAISDAARRISAGSLAERIPVKEADSELGRLAEVLNSTFARLEAAFDQQRRFTADASHELRTPIAVLLSETQLALARERTADEYRETIAACQDTAQQMRRLTESLLALSRFDAGQEVMRRESFDLADLTREGADSVLPLARGRRVRLGLALDPAPVIGDPDRLRQVVVNLLTNAIHYNREGGEVAVATRAANGRAHLHVADSGIGIPAEQLPHVFDRFFRGDPARARARGRTGLGLAICKAIVEAHHGRLEVTSEPGAGSTFEATLPAAGSGSLAS